VQKEFFLGRLWVPENVPICCDQKLFFCKIFCFFNIAFEINKYFKILARAFCRYFYLVFDGFNNFLLDQLWMMENVPICDQV
jgi:hypothetical protein